MNQLKFKRKEIINFNLKFVSNILNTIFSLKITGFLVKFERFGSKTVNTSLPNTIFNNIFILYKNKLIEKWKSFRSENSRLQSSIFKIVCWNSTLQLTKRFRRCLLLCWKFHRKIPHNIIVILIDICIYCVIRIFDLSTSK